MKVRVLFSAVFALSLAACGQQDSPSATSQAEPATAPAPVLKSGEQVYKTACMSCHLAGVANAPKTGDQAAWGALSEKGQAVVTAQGWVGVRGMPPKGGRPNLSLEEFARATTWMARSAGLDWQDPDEALLQAVREEARRLEQLKAR